MLELFFFCAKYSLVAIVEDGGVREEQMENSPRDIPSNLYLEVFSM